MQPVDKHEWVADVSFDGGDLDCGNGLLLLIRQHIDPLHKGQLLEILSTEISVEEDLPAWCRLTKNELISFTKVGKQRSFLISKGAFEPGAREANSQGKDSNKENLDDAPPGDAQRENKRIKNLSLLEQAVTVYVPVVLPEPAPALIVTPLSVMGVGSWPRPKWMLRTLHDYMEGKVDEDEFEEATADAVRLAVAAQVEAGADVITDGEQRRDNYASFVGGLLDNCKLLPLTDLLPLVDSPDEFAEELNSLDVPAEKVRHPIVFGPLGRSRPLVPEAVSLRSLTDKPLKVALPGPYLLSRIMWMDCITNEVYESREALATDIVRILREEVHYLLSEGVSLVQFDEPVLTEVVFSGAKNKRSFMCGALCESGAAGSELDFAVSLINAVTDGLPLERLAMHICRGNWTPDESVALSGDYRPLMPVLTKARVGTLFLEFCTERAGDMGILSELPEDIRVAVGVVNPKNPAIETREEIISRLQRAIDLIGVDRVLLTADCGFATFADNPLVSEEVAREKIKSMVQAADHFKQTSI
ncbi:MAG: 5-methyltetrahydropteroyltriglutamate--homocysteine methyltransferase [Cyanobacteria bacterium]|nr:5-methyltetrahydropteroyltriglutamate--homocysteine methyltransferase [Cyanobacteriota bacterium]